MHFISFNTKGFTLVELMLGIGLMSVIMLGLLNITLCWGKGWIRGSATVTLQQNVRTAMEMMGREIRYETGHIVSPVIDESSNYLEFRNSGNFRTYKYYIGYPGEYKSTATLYRYVKDDRDYTAGIDQLTEPSQVKVKAFYIHRTGINTVSIRLILQDNKSGLQEELETMVSCLNVIM